MKKGFTLAEVLITLGIIGIVAALTMPALITKYEKKKAVNQLKKTYSMINQALVMSQNDNGPISEWDFPENIAINPDKPEQGDKLEIFAHRYITPYLQIITECEPENMTLGKPCGYNAYDLTGKILTYGQYGFILKDGQIVRMSLENNGVTFGGAVYFQIDINGKKKPNTYGKDIFIIYLNNKMTAINFRGLGLNRDELLNSNYTGCNTEPSVTYKGGYCGALIQYDGWEIKDDYPW